MNAGKAGRPEAGTLWTIGHSNREWDVSLGMLVEAGIGLLVDVRRFAGSRRHPQFSGEAMAKALPAEGIDYLAMPDLGGRRRPRPDTPDAAWRHGRLRGYGDYLDPSPVPVARDRL